MSSICLRARVACVPAAGLALLAGVSVGVPVAAAQPATLDAVVVTATRTPQPQADVMGDVQVIERQTIEQSAGLSVSELLRQHAGVQMASNGGLGKQSSVFIRGTESRHVLLLIDGVRYGSATLGTPNWDNLPLAAIERIEVLRGPAASLYGSDAVGGVVQIFTRRGVAGQVQPYLSTTLGSYGRREVAAGLTGGTPQVRYALGVSALRESGFSATNAAAAFGNFNPDRDGFEQQALNAQVNWQLAPDLDVGAHVLVASGDNQFDSSQSGSALFDVRGLTTTRVAGLNLRKAWDGAGVTRVQFSRADDLTRNLFRTETTRFDTSRELWSIQHDVPSPLGTWTVGAEHTRESVDSTTRYTVRERSIDGLFLGLQGRHAQHRWQANVRRDDNSQFGAYTTGSLAYGYEFLPGWTASASSGSSFKAPTFNQLYWPDAGWGGGNPALQPEKGRSHELALEYRAGATDLRLAYFEQNFRNFIGGWPPANQERAEIDGWSLAATHAAGGWRWNAHLELLDARNTTPGASFGRKLQRRADEQLTLGVERGVGAWVLGGQALLVGERFDNVANTQRLPGFGTLNLSAERALGQDWSLQMRLNNVGDKVYQTAHGFNQPGRAFYTTLNWRPQR